MKKDYKTTEEIINSNLLPNSKEELIKLALLGKHMATIAHELNNPLSAILGYAEMLQSTELQPKAKKYADNIFISALRASKIAEALLSFIRKRQVTLVPLQIQEVIDKTLSLFEYQLKANSIKTRVNLFPTKPIKGDFHKLQQIFFNLIINSIQALEEVDGEKIISITTEQNEDRVRVFFSDNGPGIDDSLLNKLFIPFQTTKKNGSGLGLSIVHGIVKEHDGNILIMPNSEGCTFVMDFPVTTETINNDGNIKENFTGLKVSKKVLIVDDDELVMSAIGGIVKLLGYTVTFTSNPINGLEELKNNDFDVILVDYKMPKMNGIDFIKKASEFVDIRKFIIITGYIGIDTKDFNENFNIPILRKPIGIEDLKKTILERLYSK